MKLITTLTSMAVFSMLTATSQATIYWDFAQEGNNVQLTVSGSLTTATVPGVYTVYPSPGAQTDIFLDPAFNSYLSSSYRYDPNVQAVYLNTTYFRPNFTHPFYTSKLSRTTMFNISGRYLNMSFAHSTRPGYLAWDHSLGTSLTPGENINNSSLFVNTTLADLGLNSSYTSSAFFVPISNPTDIGNSIVVRVPVPEPSSSLLSILGGLFFISRRKR